ncbi:MAG: hypothetical protein IJ772_00285 [Bacilli bacterium]|nr:hypothetical protein [Bacilli bacterium]
MKGNKKLLVVAVLLLLITVSFTTYAIYKSSATGNSSIDTAAWVVKVGDTDIVANNTFTIDSIDWGTSTVGKNNKIAPGDTGTVNIVLDASGSEVDVAYEISFGDFATTVNNTKLTAKAASGSSLTGTIPYAAGTDAMKVTIPLEVKWEAVDEDTQNATDIDTAAKSLTLPVTVMARQNPGA